VAESAILNVTEGRITGVPHVNMALQLALNVVQQVVHLGSFHFGSPVVSLAK
jgi:hypothetical protein